MTAAEISGASGAAEFIIATPTAETETIVSLMRSLTTQLATAHSRIQELQGQLSGALKELEMNEQMLDIKIQHAVMMVQIVWNDQWQQPEAQASSHAAASQPAPPEDAPATSRFPELRFAEVKEDPLPDPWRPAAASPPGDPWRPAAASPPGIADQAVDGGEPLRPPHPKDFDRPTQYAGGVESWAGWSKHFKQYMGLREPRWPKLLEAAENFQGRSVTSPDEAQWIKEFRLGDIQPWKSSLNMYLEQHTKGSIKNEIIETCGVARVLDAWRIMADRGSSQRPELLHAKLSKIISPKKAVASKDVERAIAEWERDIEIYRSSKPEYIMEADQRLMLLMQLCPANLQTYFRMKTDGLTDYDKMKMIIHDWLGYSENNPQRPGKVAAL